MFEVSIEQAYAAAKAALADVTIELRILKTAYESVTLELEELKKATTSADRSSRRSKAAKE